jgi:carbon-monoxide dehydrogenase large subunit
VTASKDEPYVGRSIPRREDQRLLQGQGRYVANLALQGAMHVTFVRSTVARGRIRQIDLSAARSLPGVLAVLTADDLNRVATGPVTPTLYAGAQGAPVRLLAREDVRFVGEPMAMVITEDEYVGADAAALVEIDYEHLDPVVDFESSASSSELVNPERGTNVAFHAQNLDTDIDPVMEAASYVVTATIRQQRQANAPMETRGILATWDHSDDILEVHVSTQNPHEVRRVLAQALSLSVSAVQVVKGDVGGGFGQKYVLLTEEIAVAAAARALGIPLKWIEQRHENLTSATHARADRVIAQLGLDEHGKMLACKLDHLEDVGALPIGGSGGAGQAVVTRFSGPYAIPHISWSTTAVHTNTCRRGAYRGPWMMETTAREQLVSLSAGRESHSA